MNLERGFVADVGSCEMLAMYNKMFCVSFLGSRRHSYCVKKLKPFKFEVVAQRIASLPPHSIECFLGVEALMSLDFYFRRSN